MTMELITMLGIGITLAGLILNSQRIHGAEIKALRVEINGLREEIISLRERVAHLEGLLEGLREAVSGRRVALAEAVAEEPDQYPRK